jgi:hypothetical protein
MKRMLIAIAALLFSTASFASIELAGKYRFDAGEPTHDLVVQDYGSA